MRLTRWFGGLGAVAAGGLVAAAVWIGTFAAPPARTPSAAPARIASVTLGTDEILADLVPVERVVCVTCLVDDPEISNVVGRYPNDIPRVRGKEIERIINLKADLICVAPYNSADFLKVIERTGLSVYRNEKYESIDAIETGIVALGDRVGEPTRADKIVGTMRSRRKQLADRLADVPKRPRVLYWSSGFTAGRGSTIDDIIREGGGVNVAVELGIDGSAEITPEQAIRSEPDHVLTSGTSGSERKTAIDSHPLLRSLPAVVEKRVIAIEAKYLTAVSQFVVEAAERLARKLHPDRFVHESSP